MNYSITHLNANDSSEHLKVNAQKILHFGDVTTSLKNYNRLQQKRSSLIYNYWTKSNWNLALYMIKKRREQLAEAV